jgi:hypothetical protein
MKKALFSWLQFHCLFLVMGRSTQVQKKGNAMKQSSFFTAILFLLCWSWALCGCGAEALYYGAYALGTADAVVSATSEDYSKANKTDKAGPAPEAGDLLEQHPVGEHTVKIYEATFLNKPGYLFEAFDRSGQRTQWWIFYEQEDENDMRDFNEFLQMNPAEKKQYIRKDFLEVNKFDLGPIEPETVAEPTPPIQESASDK